MIAANPIITSYLSEFSSDPVHQWVELSRVPYQPGGNQELNGKRLVTSTSVCTFDLTNDTSMFVIVGSQSLTRGLCGHGTFRLNPDSDFIRLDSCSPKDEVTYPCLPAGLWRAPGPPLGASAALYRTLRGNFNWYVDSSPTPRSANDDYSTIQGRIQAADSNKVFYLFFVDASGPSSGSGDDLSYQDSVTDFCLSGLGPGRYWLSAGGWKQGGRDYCGSYPELLDIGYNQTRSGLVIQVFPVDAVAESRPGPVAAPVLHVAGQTLVLTAIAPVPAQLVLFDESGRCRALLHRGKVLPGRHKFDLSTRVPPGGVLRAVGQQWHSDDGKGRSDPLT